MLNHLKVAIPRPTHVLLAGGDIGVAVDHVDVGIGSSVYPALHPSNERTSGSVIVFDLEVEAGASSGEVSRCPEGEISGDGVGAGGTSGSVSVLNVTAVTCGLQIRDDARARCGEVEQDGEVSVRFTTFRLVNSDLAIVRVVCQRGSRRRRGTSTARGASSSRCTGANRGSCCGRGTCCWHLKALLYQ